MMLHAASGGSSVSEPPPSRGNMGNSSASSPGWLQLPSLCAACQQLQRAASLRAALLWVTQGKCSLWVRLRREQGGPGGS